MKKKLKLKNSLDKIPKEKVSKANPEGKMKRDA
jgi:hypothetical protein